MSLNQSLISDFSEYYRWSQRTKIKLNCTMVDVRGDVLRPPHAKYRYDQVFDAFLLRCCVGIPCFSVRRPSYQLPFLTNRSEAILKSYKQLSWATAEDLNLQTSYIETLHYSPFDRHRITVSLLYFPYAETPHFSRFDQYRLCALYTIH